MNTLREVMTSVATHCTAMMNTGKIYNVIVVADAGFVLVQPAGCAGWAQVSIVDLPATDRLDDLVVEAIHAAFVDLRPTPVLEGRGP